MKFRPCIDIHNGKVKQIVGSSLKDENDKAVENYVSEKDSSYYAQMYKRDGLTGGHIIRLNSAGSEYFEATKRAAVMALGTYYKGMQIGGGINADNAGDYLASPKVLCCGGSWMVKESLIKEGKMPRYMGKCRHLTEEQIAQFKAEGRKPTVRFRVPADQQILVRDMVRGDVVFDSNNIGDFVIVKSDGIPTYNYAVVIDDALMHITHVIRAEEHLSNTPRQCLVYDALGFKQPTFGHISLILGKDHTKMSKRHGATSVDQYRQLGYLPEAINNFLALLGWAPNSEQEIFSMDELIHEFSMDRVAKNPAVFDIDKLNWINQHYMRQLDAEAFFEAAKPHMIAAGYMTGEEEGEKLAWLKRVVATAQEHISYAAQIPECVEMYFNDEFNFENEEAEAVLKAETVPTVINMLLEELPKVENLDNVAVKALFKQIQKATKLKGKDVFMPIRVALTGNQHGPELAAMVPLLGVERTAKRIKSSLAKAGVTL